MDGVTPRKVSWGAVLGGIAIAGLSAIVVTPASMVLGAWLSEVIGRNPASVPIAAGLAAIAAAVAIWLLWLMTRRNRDLGMGVIIGGALVVLMSGGCGALLSSFSMGGGIH